MLTDSGRNLCRHTATCSPLPQAGAFLRLPLIPAAGGVCAPLLRDSRPEPASERRAMANEVATIPSRRVNVNQPADNQETRPAYTRADRCLFVER